MKRVLLIGSISLIVLVIGLLVFIQNVNINRLGTDHYYVQIQDGKRIDETADDGKKYFYYEYTLEAFDQDGNSKTLTFNANKELRKDAYLRLYVKPSGVSSYQEVQESELPKQAKQRLDSLKE